MDYDDYIHQDLTGKIINAFFKVYNTLGFGFLEKVYENAMVIELRKMGLIIEQQRRTNVYYDGIIVGDYFADLIVNDIVIVELKASNALQSENEYQLINYLKATQCEVGLLLNFGEKPEFKRKIFSN